MTLRFGGGFGVWALAGGMAVGCGAMETPQPYSDAQWSYVNPALDAPPAPIVLEVDGLVARGETVTVTITLPVPITGIGVFLPISNGGLGAGICPGPLGGDCLGITGNIDLHGPAMTVNGVTQVDYFIEPNYPTNVVSLQAVVLAGGTAYLSPGLALPIAAVAEEPCDDGLDGDGDGATDCADADCAAHPWCVDADSDGYTLADGDCDDADADENPTALWYPDADGDGYGDPTAVASVCERSAPSDVLDHSDCDDNDAASNVVPVGACDCAGNFDDCAGVCGGSAVYDQCGVCDGDGTTCTPPGACDMPPLWAPSVGVNSRTFEDNNGPYLGLGATMFWAAWGYKNDINKLHDNLQFLADSGFNSFRALGVVGDVNAADYWDGREIDANWPDYDDVIAGVTDLAYDQYGLRVEWTLIGDGQVTVPTTAQKYDLADRFLAMSQGREHKIVFFETANEYWLNGFEGASGLDELRELTEYIRVRTDILVAASAPAGHECSDAEAVYDGCVADLATIHFDRTNNLTEGAWRPVRQPWEHQFCNLPVGINNEPIGPGASVESEEDPLKLVSAAIVTYVSGLPMYVFHSSAGVRGFENLWDMPGASSFSNLHQMLPADLSSWESKNAHWGDSPFEVFAGDEYGVLHPDVMWVDLNGPTSGVVRSYAAVQGNDFVAFPMGILGSVTMAPREGMDFEVLDPITGTTLQCHSLPAGEQFQLTGMDAFLIKGSYWCGGAPCGPNLCEPPPPGCGDGLCQLGTEDCESCLMDCPCPLGEVCDAHQCVEDGGAGPICGDAYCAPGMEDCGLCPGDCPCPNGEVCEVYQCVDNTPIGPVCGDGVCDLGVEDCGGCIGDCPCPGGQVCENSQCVDEFVGPVCGDGSCAPGVEDCGVCPGDCPCPGGQVCENSQCVDEFVGPVCGDGSCAPGVEDCGVCPGDCPCPGGQVCENQQCVDEGGGAPYCGDGSCEPGVEDCGTCAQDCPCPGGMWCPENWCVEQ